MTKPIEYFDTYELERPMREAKKRRLEQDREREEERKGEEEREKRETLATRLAGRKTRFADSDLMAENNSFCAEEVENES